MLSAAKEKDITTWVEPFVGGANIIDKVPANFRRIGIDCNEHTIKALIAIRDLVNELPTEVSENYYKSLKGTDPHPITSLIRFGASFGGKFENGYARSLTSKGEKRDHWAEARRNAVKQNKLLQGVELSTGSYEELNCDNCLIYCDPPYEGTTSYKTGVFNHLKFWDWCRKMSKTNLVFVSEYKAPDDFECIWQGEISTNFASQRNNATHKAIEKLFKLKTHE